MVRIKANVGAASFPDHGNNLQAVMAAADRDDVQGQGAARAAEGQADHSEALTRAAAGSASAP